MATVHPHIDVLTPGSTGRLVPAPAGDALARSARIATARVDAALRRQLGRGINADGSPVRVEIRFGGDRPVNQAMWDDSGFVFGNARGVRDDAASYAHSAEVAMHEAAHKLLEEGVDLRLGGVQRGINESFADVIATTTFGDDWVIGNDIPALPQGLRDVAAAAVRHVRQRGRVAVPPGEYAEAGVPSTAAVRIADTIGRHATRDIWLTAVTKFFPAAFGRDSHELNGDGIPLADARRGLPTAAQATLDAARLLYGSRSQQVRAVHEGWRSVGVL